MARKVVVGAVRATCVQVAAAVSHAAASTVTKLRSAATAARADERVCSPAAAAAVRLMEPLESRQFLNGITMGSDGILWITGYSGQKNTINVTTSGSNYVAKLNSTSKTVASSSIKQIKIYGNDWADSITVASGVTKPTRIESYQGSDTISAGGGNDTVYGGTGNDKIYGNNGNDLLKGDDGNDSLYGGAGTDTLDGGNGTDFKHDGAGSTTSTPTSSTTTSVSVSALEIWDASANKKIQTLTSGSTIDLAKLPSKITFVAQGTGASVKFAYDSNSNYRTESAKPWSITGDISGKVMPMTVSTGSHTIKVTPYTKSGATGTAGATKTWTFNVTRSSSTSSGGGSTSTPTPSTSSGSTSGGGIAPRSTSAASPDAVIYQSSSTTIHAGQSFHANAMSSKLNVGSPLTARYQWNFDDAGSKYNIVDGFNAAHFYARPGTYDVKLTVWNEAGKSDTATIKVTVLAEGRKKIYVSNDGSDSNDGLSTSKPLKTFAKARTKLGDNVEILFNGGDSFDVTDGLNIYRRNVVVGSYGSGKATLKWVGGLDYNTVFWLGGQGGGEVTIENLIFDSKYTDDERMPQAVGVAGDDNTIIKNEFRHMGYGVNANSKPDGLLVQDNTAPLSKGIRDYFAWIQGTDLTFFGNSVANSIHEHVLRDAGTDRLNISFNDFHNPTLSGEPFNKGTLTIHEGNYTYISGNVLTDGSASVGPLGRQDGLAEKGARLNYTVLENNTFNSEFFFLHGLNHTIFRNNVMKVDNNAALEVDAYSNEYNRGVVDLTIVNNTVINKGSKGNFIRVLGDADSLNLVNNLYLAPNLSVGTSGSAPVFVYWKDISMFDKITNNVWASPSIDKYAEGGINYVWPNWSNATGYKTPAEWEAYGQVGKDYYEDIGFNSSTFAPSTSASNDDKGIVWAGVFTDKNGKVRSNTGSWTVGAVDV
jgi:hypothetical protein